jgi:hypothetical protein
MFRFTKPETWPYMPMFEKIGYYKTILNADYAPYVDKLLAKDKVREICPEVRIARVVRVLDGPDDIHIADLNPHHLLKAVHGCGWNTRLEPSLDVAHIRKQLSEWNIPYSGVERQYAYIAPQFFIEEIIDDAYTGISGKARVFMFRCIHGKPTSVGVRDIGAIQHVYTTEFELLGAQKFPLEKPAQWDAMLNYATQLSAPFEFVRIDFYIGADGHVYFSEYTFTPAGGSRVFSMKLEHQYGRLWK